MISSLFKCIYFGLEVSSVGKFHNDAQCACCLLEKSFFVTGYIGMTDWCEDANFVYCVVFFFLSELGKFNLQQFKKKP